MPKRNLKRDIQFMDMLLDDNDKIDKNVVIECFNCQGRAFEVSGDDGTVLMCKECETAISISFVDRKNIEINGEIFYTGDIVENEAFRDIVVFRDGVLTTKKNASGQPLETYKNLKVIGNTRDNPEMVKEMREKQKEAEQLISQELIDATKRMEIADRNIAERKQKEDK